LLMKLVPEVTTAVVEKVVQEGAVEENATKF